MLVAGGDEGVSLGHESALDVGGQTEVSRGPQEAWADDRDCVCPPGPDTTGTASCS